MNVDAERDGEAPGDKDSGEGTSEGRSAGNSKGLGRTGLLQKQVSMGEKSADIVIGALQKVGQSPTAYEGYRLMREARDTANECVYFCISTCQNESIQSV